MKEGEFLRGFLLYRQWIEKDITGDSWHNNNFRAFCKGRGWNGGFRPSNASSKKPGMPAGMMPCCIEEETGRPLVLLGLEKDGWCTFQGRPDKADTSLGYTAAREGAEEMVYALGSTEEI